MSYREETQASLSCGWDTTINCREAATLIYWETRLWIVWRTGSGLLRDATLICWENATLIYLKEATLNCWETRP